MSAEESAPAMSVWTPRTGAEPSVRIGIVLDRDACGRTELRLPAQQYALRADGKLVETLAAGTGLSARLAGDAVAVHVGDRLVTTASVVRLEGRSVQELAPGAGVLVRDVVAGRGFHWQKHIDQTLSGTLEMLPGQDGLILVNELPLEEYLAGVITAEMSGACPAALLEAQSVVARSWLLAMTEIKHERDPFDRCNDDCCQRYQGTDDLSATALAAVHGTRGQVLLAPGGAVLDANYAKSCGGVTELPQHVWKVEKPGLSAVVDAPLGELEHRFLPVTERNLDDFLDGSWLESTRMYCSPQVVSPELIGRYLGRVDEAGDYFRWTVHYSRAGLEALLREKLPETRELTELRDIRVLARGVSGRANSVGLEWRDERGEAVRVQLESEYRIRAVLHRKFLYSSAFAVRAERDQNERLKSVTLRGAGWGHGVGLCQIGALGMALTGGDCRAICRHYYPEAQLTTVYG
ncbi:MAG: SpoIID/LytB domain-containing protein [Planctomycetes bacterium]|nr:SpoIID/LytB domain-containing protein [Planctomycetota bacterium]